MSLPTQLATVLEALYLEFAPYRPTGGIKHSPLKSHADVLPLETKPLRHLTAEDFSGYSGAAVWTIGSAADFKYFFPRLAELALHEAVGSAGWDSWAARLAPALTNAELKVTQEFFTVLWNIAVTTEENIIQVEVVELLYALPFFFDELAPLLTMFHPCASRITARHLKHLCTRGPKYVSPHHTKPAALWHWLTQRAPAALAAAAVKFPDL